MTIIAEWVMLCTNDGCGAEVFRSIPIPKPKVGDYPAYQEWFHMDGTPTKLNEPFVCGTCCKWFQPMAEAVLMTRYIGDDHE